jgi:hypothetical protein
MTNSTKNVPALGTILQRPSLWVPMDGFVNGYKPNAGGEGGTVFIGTTREVKRTSGTVKENHCFFVSVWGNDATMLESMANYNKQLKANNEETLTFMVNFSSNTGHINAKQGETQYGMNIRGNSFVQVDPKTYAVVQTSDAFVAQQS